MNLQEDLIGYGTVWFHPGGIANILSLSKTEEKYRVYYDSTGEKKISSTYPEEEMVQYSFA